MINPALHAHPAEAAQMGILVISYGELDISMLDTVGQALGLRFPVLDAADVVNSELTRIEIAKRLGQHLFQHLNLGQLFEYALDAQDFCREVRNYYAHCHFADIGGQLAAAKARDLFSDHSMSMDKMSWYAISPALLDQQDAYFEHTRKWWLWLATAAFDLKHRRQPILDEPTRMAKPEKRGELLTPRPIVPSPTSPPAPPAPQPE